MRSVVDNAALQQVSFATHIPPLASQSSAFITKSDKTGQ
jgi:hypothetical protein